jgi:hypothetical protein
VQQDGVHRQQAVDLLKTSWGADMQINTNLVSGLMAGLPEAVRPLMEQGRLEDGRLIMNSPEVLVWFADMARKLNPQAALGINANDGIQAIDDEIAALKAKMGTKEWANDTAGQARYMQLIDGKTAMEKQ